ncbi:MFS transporter [Paenibacillus xerothermodurans]|uniref:MFS transporter n=1 Tax=Paenibacillus xerothermodurans TaxID=1977292 RepID=A0A2W1NI05_PAEXE|nr:MFS transporter [Paenibacillus xerothermodurans]PZE22781.1 MFS transporter [Paenibacillus xerothermodurans]
MITKTSVSPARAGGTLFSILFAVSLVHLLNDTIQSVVPAIFPIVKESLQLSYTQLGLIAFALNATASILQPAIGFYSDSKPKPYLLPLGMAATLVGVLGLALAGSFSVMLLSVALVGIGSAVFHPESAKIAYMAAGQRRGLAQSIFQVGGSTGQALAPIMTALIFVPLGQFGIIWFTIAAAAAIAIQTYTARWYSSQLRLRPAKRKLQQTAPTTTGSRRQVRFAVSILLLLVSTKMAYLAAITSFYSFYLIEHFQLPIGQAQWIVFGFLFAGAVGTFFGGAIADLWGRRNMIWFSIIAALPFALALPYVNVQLSVLFSIIIGLTIMSSGSVTVVYAQELLPGKVGTVSGLFFGLSFGMGGLSAAALGMLADATSIGFVIKLCALLPLLGLMTILLPSDTKLKQWSSQAEQSQVNL